MVLMEWDTKLATGIATVDEQHKKLVSLVNELHDAMKAGKAKTAVEHVLDELQKYTVYHFSTEERAFAAYNYPQMDEHKKHHKELVDQLAELVQKHKKGELAISIDVLDFLVGWVKQHILKDDMLYVPYLKDKTIEG